MILRVGVDTGGTFTDFVWWDNGRLRIAKIPSTPDDPARAVRIGLDDIGPDRIGEVVHGSTVATNAFLERKGARTVLLTTAGFEDVLHIGRQTRARLYDLQYRRPPPLVPPECRIGVCERIGPNGEVIRPLTDEEIQRVRARVFDLNPESVAIVLLFAYADPTHERRLRDALRDLAVPIVLSSEVFPEYREYERTVVTVLNAYLAPVVQRYLQRLQTSIRRPIWITSSSGGVLSMAQAMRTPIQMLLSGPVAGVMAARFFTERMGIHRWISLDMGGTSADIALYNGTLPITQEVVLETLPIKIPMVDIHTIGAGGGSIAWRDPGGALRVGPRSAGADPGPIAYDRGGTDLTVTDAHLYLGRLPAEYFLGGRMRLNVDATRAAMERFAQDMGLAPEDLAEGIIEVANVNMERALRRVSVERGLDPRDFVLFAFGGAGGLHACELAERLGMRRVIVPPHAGVVSALGTLVADHIWTFSRSILQPVDRLSDDRLRTLRDDLIRRGLEEMQFLQNAVPPVIETFLQMRYRGQAYELLVPYRDSLAAAVERFHVLHRQRYGFMRPERPCEVVGMVVRLTRPMARVEWQPDIPTGGAPVPVRVQRMRYRGQTHEVPVYVQTDLPVHASLTGPAILCDPTATTFLPPGWTARVHSTGCMDITRTEG